MIAVLQRVTDARVDVDHQTTGQIGLGILALVAVERDDCDEDVRWMAEKLVSLRMFRTADRHFEQDVRQVAGAILLVSNFTVAAQTRKGRRPSFEAAASPERGRELFDRLAQRIRDLGVTVATGRFGADMRVSLVNDGPVTFILSTPRSAGPDRDMVP